MTYDELRELDSQYYMEVFGERLPVVFDHGKDAHLFDIDGKEYVDFLAGIAVNALGYSDGGFQETLRNQIGRVIHTCNYFYNEPQAKLAQLLCKKTGFDRVFFGNSGAEANECALKLAKKYAFRKGRDTAKFVCLKNSFHGRTLLTLSATGQEKFHTAFAPMAYDFITIEANDMDAAKAAVTQEICGVILEVVQGESGVFPLEKEFVQLVADLCSKQDVMLIIDEVQTGMGRTGTFLAQEKFGVKADITTLAKALGNGVPIGACLANAKAASAFTGGDHGSTFGGNPLACAAGLYVTEKIDGAMLGRVGDLGGYFKSLLQDLMEKHPDRITDVRGMGLMLGAQLSEKEDAHDVALGLLKNGVVIGTAGCNTLRFVPPFVLTKGDIDHLIDALEVIFS